MRDYPSNAWSGPWTEDLCAQWTKTEKRPHILNTPKGASIASTCTDNYHSSCIKCSHGRLLTQTTPVSCAATGEYSTWTRRWSYKVRVSFSLFLFKRVINNRDGLVCFSLNSSQPLSYMHFQLLWDRGTTDILDPNHTWPFMCLKETFKIWQGFLLTFTVTTNCCTVKHF